MTLLKCLPVILHKDFVKLFYVSDRDRKIWSRVLRDDFEAPEMLEQAQQARKGSSILNRQSSKQSH